jgi:hypothetical protein
MSKGKRRHHPPQPQKQDPPNSSIWQRLGKIWSIVIAVGSIGGLLSISDKAWDFLVAQTRPEILPPTSATDPFSLPFSIKNRSAFFDMTDAQWLCGVERIKTNTLEILGLSLTTNAKTTIEPGDTILVTCPVDATSDADATIKPIIKYKTLGIARSYDGPSLTWLKNGNPARWVYGRPYRDSPRP